MLVAISVSSVLLVNKARDASSLVVHTVEVESQLANLLLEIRRAESATRAYLLTSAPQFLAEYETAAGNILPTADQLAKITNDNPVQVENYARLRKAIEQRLSEFARGIDRVKNNDVATSVTVLRNGAATGAVEAIAQAGRAMRAEEDRLFAMRTANADRAQVLASSVTIAGSGLVIALAGISIFLVRRSSRARDEAEERLRDNNLNLETTVDERTADLREANDEIQRFAYIVSHDLRSPLVNIMGFTSELEELRGDIFRRIAALSRIQSAVRHRPGKRHRYRRARARRRRQAALGGLHRGARVHQVVDRQDGPADIGDPQSHPRGAARVRAGPDRHQGVDRGHRDNRGASSLWKPRPRSRSTHCRISSATALRWSRSSPI